MEERSVYGFRGERVAVTVIFIERVFKSGVPQRGIARNGVYVRMKSGVGGVVGNVSERIGKGLRIAGRERF